MKHPNKLLAAISLLAATTANAAGPTGQPVSKIEFGKTYIIESVLALDDSYRYLSAEVYSYNDRYNRLTLKKSPDKSCLWVFEPASDSSKIVGKNVENGSYLFQCRMNSGRRYEAIPSLSEEQIRVSNYQFMRYAFEISAQLENDTRILTCYGEYSSEVDGDEYRLGSEPWNRESRCWYIYEADSETALPIEPTDSAQIAPVEFDVDKVKYKIPLPGVRDAYAVAVGVASGNFSLDGLEIADNVTYNGMEYPVVQVADEAFENNKGFTGELKIGNNVRTIGDRAFRSCSGFTSLKLSNSLEYIGKEAFNWCDGLTGSLELPNTLHTIQAIAFCGCRGFYGNLELPTSLVYIGRAAFSWCENFTGSLVLPNSITSLESEVFDGCIGFNGLTLPSSITRIGFQAFNNCTGLTGSLVIPDGVTSIGRDAFANCTGFTGTLTLPNSLAGIGSTAFANCTGFNGTLTLPNSLTEIGYDAFINCSGFTGSLEIPEGMTRIESRVFEGCTGMTGTLIIPASITEMKESFSNCRFSKVLSLNETPPSAYKAFDRTPMKELCVPDAAVAAYKLVEPWMYFEKINSIEPLTGIDFAEANIVCPLGGNITLKVNRTPLGAGGEISFRSLNTEVATVNDKGVVSGHMIGRTEIVATCENFTATCQVSVEKPMVPISDLQMDGFACAVGESVKVRAKVLPYSVTEATVVWTSSNPEVAAVDQEGTVWFNAAGDATVTAECQGYEFSVPFVVKEVVARALNVFPVEAVGGVGHEFSLLALHEPENTTDKSVTWESSDPEVATVSEDGRVSLAALGSAQITARSGEHTAVCAVTVDNTVGLTEMASSGVVIDIVDGGIVVRNVAAGESIAVYTVDGKVANGAIVENDETRLNLAAGIYIVKVSPSTVAKVLVK